MSKRKRLIWICAIIVALVIVLLTAKAITDNSLHILEPTPTVTASPDVTLKYPEPEINASDKAKLTNPKPKVTTQAAPKLPAEVPASIPPEEPVSSGYFSPPFTAPQYPLRSPQPPLSQPNVPSPVQPLPPAVTRPVEGLTEPLPPITDPLLDPIKDIIPKQESCQLLETITPSSVTPLIPLC